MLRRASVRLVVCWLLVLPALALAQDSRKAADAALPAACPHPPEALIVLRHACKATRCPASVLNELGNQQARDLARDLASHSVDAIFVTTSERTQQTAAVLASEIGQPVDCRIADPTRRCLRDEPVGIDNLLAEICSGRYAGQVVLHVGHFHTLPRVFSRLGLNAPRSYLSAKPWRIDFGEDGAASYEELRLEHTTPLGSNACGTIACASPGADG